MTKAGYLRRLSLLLMRSYADLLSFELVLNSPCLWQSQGLDLGKSTLTRLREKQFTAQVFLENQRAIVGDEMEKR